MVELLLAGGAAYGGYKYTKKFVVKKLRFVPKARKKAAPWLAGVGALAVAVPLVAALPIIGALTAAAFGIMGTSPESKCRWTSCRHSLPIP